MAQPDTQQTGTYVLKCVSCVALNTTLPILCPGTDMPCFMLRPEKIRACAAKHAGMSIRDGRIGREPMNSEYMDEAAIRRMKEAYEKIPAGMKPDIKY